ncbi:uncharacterized protein AB675_2536 [Cyphellophora attinorum]|uniref:Abscission/NoCut checkpoint regulator n=1 Tax=Cyphellophora attinorum TaxID=1664694 RepID=A0A0N1HB48_9EURO|nr:uncharacterized protein AB675_2536 [Phialophora attinorum]KPI45350.1 hypothetical protein AB675_2536 [Phialophora attinorum]
MSSGKNADNDLLARLNALKKSTIALDTPTLAPPRTQVNNDIPIDPSAGRALHEALSDRFKLLSGGERAPVNDNGRINSLDEGEAFPGDNDDRTFEELLADLGPADQWNVGKTEQDEVNDLLRSAGAALNSKPALETIPGEAEGADSAATKFEHTLPSVDVTAFQPEPDSDDEDGESASSRPTKTKLNATINDEADAVLQRLLDEVKYEEKHGSTPDQGDEASSAHEDDETTDGDEKASDGAGNVRQGRDTGDTGAELPGPKATTSKAVADPFATLSLPSAPKSALPSLPVNKSPIGALNTADSDLASRFASLSLPTTINTPSLPPVPTTTTKTPKTKFQPTDEEIDTWCSICLDNATLSCLGCDGELYCTNCWLEGHRGEDAGMEERGHRAVQFGGKKQAKKKVAMGA